MKTTCPNCGTIFEDGSMFCNKCGSKLEVEVPIETAPYVPEDTAPLEAYTPQHTPNETITTKQPEAVAPTATIEKKTKKVKKKTGLIAGIIGGIVGIPLILIIVLIIALSSGDDNNTEETTASTPTTQATQYTSQLSDDIFEFTIKLNGVVYKFPETVDNFESNGWVIADDKKSATLEPQESIDVSAKNDTGYITLHFFNDGDTAKSVKDCQVGGVTLSFNRSNTYTIELSKGLVLTEESTLTDIIFLWGEYSGVELDKYFFENVKTKDNSSTYVFETNKDNTLFSVTIKNFNADKTDSGLVLEGIDVTTGNVAETLSDKLEDGVIGINGKAYSFPIKVSDLTSAGWELTIGSTKLAPNEITALSFSYGNEQIFAGVINTTDTEIQIDEAILYDLEYSFFEIDSGFEFANGIKPGMSKDAFLKATTDFELEFEESGEATYYKTPYTGEGFSYKFKIDESGILSSIRIVYEY